MPELGEVRDAMRNASRTLVDSGSYGVSNDRNIGLAIKGLGEVFLAWVMLETHKQELEEGTK